MIQTKSAFDKTALKLLINVQNERFYPDDFDFELSDEDFHYVVSELDDDFCLKGYEEVFFGSEVGYKAIDPTVTTAGQEYIEMVIHDYILLPLAKKVSREGYDIHFSKEQIEKTLNIKHQSIEPFLADLEERDVIVIQSKVFSENELIDFRINLTADGYEEFSHCDFYKIQPVNTYNITHNSISNSNVFQGNFQINDSFKKELNSTNLSEEDKIELISLITDMLNSRQLTTTNESKFKKIISNISSKFGDAATAESVSLIVKILLDHLS